MTQIITKAGTINRFYQIIWQKLLQTSLNSLAFSVRQTSRDFFSPSSGIIVIFTVTLTP
jgi:hypothetical protein